MLHISQSSPTTLSLFEKTCSTRLYIFKFIRSISDCSTSRCAKPWQSTKGNLANAVSDYGYDPVYQLKLNVEQDTMTAVQTVLDGDVMVVGSSEMSLGEMKGKKRREEKGSRRGLFKGTFISI